jgi:hypothetical protein
MKNVTIGEFKKKLPDLLADVSRGESILLQKGRRRENVALLTPPPRETPPARRLGLLAKRGKPVFRHWEMDPESLLTPLSRDR